MNSFALTLLGLAQVVQCISRALAHCSWPVRNHIRSVLPSRGASRRGVSPSVVHAATNPFSPGGVRHCKQHPKTSPHGMVSSANVPPIVCPHSPRDEGLFFFGQ
eukprot:8294510-Pyramimonas_sp.AAC.1